MIDKFGFSFCDVFVYFLCDSTYTVFISQTCDLLQNQ